MMAKLLSVYTFLVATVLVCFYGLSHQRYLYWRYRNWKLIAPTRFCGVRNISMDTRSLVKWKESPLYNPERDGHQRSKKTQPSVCPDTPQGLQGWQAVDVSTKQTMEQINSKNTKILRGGYYNPLHCKAQHKVAILIPYRNRYDNLLIFLRHMPPIFTRQNIEFRLYVIEQAGDCSFNRGMLFNAGVLEASKDMDWDCYCFHDVDLMLEDDRLLYTCPEMGPRALAISQDKWDYKIKHKFYFGGVVIMSKQQYLTINGFSNVYWGWGREDDDLLDRVEMMGMKADRADSSIGRYTNIKEDHIQGPGSVVRDELIQDVHYRVHVDGLNTTVYKVISREEHPLYTKITVALGDTRIQIPSAYSP